MKISVEARARLLFAMVLMAGAAAGVIWYFYQASQYTTYEIVTQDSVSGLLADAPVEFHGVEVGKVQRVELIGPHSVRIMLKVRKEAPLTTTTVATITSRGLATRGFTGYVYISLEDSGGDSRPLATEPGDLFPRLHTAPSRSVNLDTAISQVNENVQAVTELLRTALDPDTITALRQSAGNLQRITRTLAENNQKLNAIIANTRQASEQFQPLLESGHATVKALQFQILPETYRTIEKLNKLSDSLNDVANKIDRQPSVLLRGSAQPAPGPGENE